MHTNKTSLVKGIAFSLIAYFLYIIEAEFYQVAWGTGTWIGEFSLNWGVIFAVFSFFLIALLSIVWIFLWKNATMLSVISLISTFRNKLRFFLYLIAIIFLILPSWLLQYTLWGLVFTNIYFRLFIWVISAVFLAILFTQEEALLISWNSLLSAILLSGLSFTVASVFSNVSDYPFNLYWSDGNRIWDYSIMFGRHLYNYPVDQPLNAFISSGRQFLWGLPFLIPNTTILFHRFWSALVLSLPYVILGWVAFKAEENRRIDWLLIGLWSFLFLNQGPIYSPLVISAIAVAIAWQRPLWIAIPLVAFAGYYAEITRFTWEFAPAIWAGMLEISGTPLKGERRALLIRWGRAISLAFAGISIWYILPTIQKIWGNESVNSVAETFTGIQGTVSAQPLLWNRLLPNDTYPEGVLGGLLIAVLPITFLLLYLIKEKIWKPSLWQKLAMLGSLFVFLVVGIIISTKIGGGNNLHNLDMFLIALLFVTTVAWRNGGSAWFSQSIQQSLYIKVIVILLIALPALSSLGGLQPNLSLTIAEIQRVQILADIENVNTLPSQVEINNAIWYITQAIDSAKDEGEILFIDQRQLLTFGNVPNAPLVPEYEKKRMMDEAMGSDAAYFAPYYHDLASHRFSLIISEPLKVGIKKEEGSFAAENDLWAVWVAAPTLCYYEPIETLRPVYIQLLVPRQEPVDCSTYLP